MPTILDINLTLLEPIARVAFKEWLRQNITNPVQRRRFIRLWCQATETTWPKRDYDEMQVRESD